MNEITFNELPKVVSLLSDKLDNIERLLLAQSSSQQPKENKFLSIKEASVMISLSVPTIYGLVHRSAIPCMKRNKRLYFSRQELTDWITSGRKSLRSEIEADALHSLSLRKNNHK
jgi:predicted DNA-binding transcriptional regulator AlpA